LEAGLPEAVKLSVGPWTHYQKLDYEHLPFKCRNCQEHGHFQRNCPKKQTTGTEDAEGWQKVKRGKNSNNAKGKDKKNQESVKGGQPSQNAHNVHDNSQSNPSPAEGTEGVADPPLAPLDSSSPTKRPNLDNAYISLHSNTDTEIQDEEEGEASSPKGTPEQPKRGRKSEKKCREEQASKEVAQGTQLSIPEMVHTRSGAKPGKTPKGGLPPPPNK